LDTERPFQLHSLLDIAEQQANWEQLDDFLAKLSAEAAGLGPFETAVRGGAFADRVGFAFVAGYQNALRSITGASAAERLCLSVTEEGGGHPKAIKAALSAGESGFWLSGKKKWATMAGFSDHILVAASVGSNGSRNQIRIAKVARNSSGLTIEQMPDTPFAPEIKHFKLTFDAVPVANEAVFAGDGYIQLIKPVRTGEDTFVFAALIAYMLRLSRSAGWGAAVSAELLSLLGNLERVSQSPPLSPETHVILHGAIQAAHRLMDTLDMSALPEEAKARWERDRGLTQIASRARGLRFEKAWQALSKSEAAS